MAYKKKIGSWQDLWLGGGNWKPRRKTRRTQGAIPGGMREPNFWASTKPMSTQALEHGPGRTAAPPWVQNMIDARSQFDANKYRVDANKYRVPDATGGAPSDLFPTGGMLWDGLGDEPQMTQDQIDAGYQFGAPEDQQRMSLLDRAGDFISRKWEGRDKTPMDSPVNRGLIQFGLSAMNPDTYYNRQGFGIGALGAFSKAGQAGLAEHDKVREILGKQKERATKERLAEIEERKLMQGEKDPTSVAEWKQALEEEDPDALKGYGHWNRKMTGLRSGMYSPDLKTALEINTEFAGKLPDRRQEAMKTVGSLESLRNSRNLLRDQEIFTGRGAEFKGMLVNFLANNGFIDRDSPLAKKEQLTGAYFANMAKLTAENIKNFGAGTGLSDKDLEFANKMSGGDQTMDRESIEKLLNLNELYMRKGLEKYNRDIDHIMKSGVGEKLIFNIGLPNYGAESPELRKFMMERRKKYAGRGDYTGGAWGNAGWEVEEVRE